MQKVGLEIASSVSTEEESYSVFHGLMARKVLLLCRDVKSSGLLVPKEAR